jgi:hypothetical protein
MLSNSVYRTISEIQAHIAIKYHVDNVKRDDADSGVRK